jgi:hypothetical protein
MILKIKHKHFSLFFPKNSLTATITLKKKVCITGQATFGSCKDKLALAK